VRLISSQRKFQWGVEHANRVCGDATAFENGKAYVLDTKKQVRSREEVLYECFAVERTRMPEDWPLVLGDAIQNIRSSLDHAIWDITPKRTRSRRTAFPIFTDRCEFQVRGSPMIAGIPSPIRTSVENIQPYKTLLGNPDWDPLAILATLNNLDKHRTLVAVASKVDVPWIGSDDADIRFLDVGDGRVMQEGTKVMAFTVNGPEAEKMHVHPDFAYEVQVEGMPLARTIRRIVDHVAIVLDALEGNRVLPDWEALVRHERSP
jgi:hypothetical protein